MIHGSPGKSLEEHGQRSTPSSLFFLIFAKGIVGSGKVLITVSLKYCCIFKLKDRLSGSYGRTHNAKAG